MGASEDRATRAEHERQRKAADVEEIIVPGYGIWHRERIKNRFDERDRLIGELVVIERALEEMAHRLKDRNQQRKMGLL